MSLGQYDIVWRRIIGHWLWFSGSRERVREIRYVPRGLRMIASLRETKGGMCIATIQTLIFLLYRLLIKSQLWYTRTTLWRSTEFHEGSPQQLTSTHPSRAVNNVSSTLQCPTMLYQISHMNLRSDTTLLLRNVFATDLSWPPLPRIPLPRKVLVSYVARHCGRGWCMRI